MKRVALITSLVVAGSFVFIGSLLADPITGTYITGPDPDNQAVYNGDGTYTLTSTASTYSWVDLSLNQTVTFSQLTTLYADFTDISGGADVGAPRLTLYLSNGGDINVLLGTAPNYNDIVTSLNAYSGVNLIGNNDTGRYDTSNDGLAGGNPFTTYSGALAQAGLGGLVVTDIQFTLDGGWGSSGTQKVILNSIDGAPVPDATSTAGLFGLGLFGLAVFGFRQNRQQMAK